MMRKATFVLAGICLLAISPDYAGAKGKGQKKKAPESTEPQEAEPKVFHLPVSEAPVSEPLILRARITAAWQMSRAEVRYRRIGERHYVSAELERSSTGGYAATIPAKKVAPPGIEYYIVSKDRKGDEREHFANPSSPHKVVIHGTPDSIKIANDLARHRGNHSRARVSSEYIDFGDREGHDDWYWQLELDYTYRILKIPYYIRLGYRRLRSSSGEVRDPGIDYGFAELDFHFHDLVGAKVKIITGATLEGFAIGGGATLRIGYDPGTHVDLVFEGAQDLGMTSFLRLVWDTVPGFPMAASVGVTNYPGNGDFAVQMIFDVRYRLFDSVTLAVRAGYQARDYLVGGPMFGGSVIYEF